MRVIVVGGGIAGLGVTVALKQHGHEVVVLEQAPRLEAVGAGITLFANAMHALRRLGIADAVAAKGAAARDSAILTATGWELTRIPAELLSGAVAIHRAELQAVLAEAAGDVRLGVRVSRVQQTAGGVTATITNGGHVDGDLLVGADGLRSLVRDAVVASQPRYSGYTAWRGISPRRIADGHLSESWGIGERFGLVDIGVQTYWFATANTPEGGDDDPAGRKAEIIRRFARWHAPIADVVDATPESAILRDDVYFLDPLTRWSDRRIVLTGDAAHATTPGIGQGAALALEDAVALADEIARHADLNAALARFESTRRPRAKLVLKLSRRADRLGQLANPVACRLRNAVARRIPQSAQRRQFAPVIEYQLP